LIRFALYWECMSLINRLVKPIRQLRWKLTLSYSVVTVGSLFVIVMILGYLLFSRVLVPLDILNSVLTPEIWIKLASENAPPEWSYVLSQNPLDTKFISLAMRDEDYQITHIELFRIGDLQVQLRTASQGSGLLVDSDGILLGSTNNKLVSDDAIGQPLDMDVLPGLEEPLNTALRGDIDPERLFVVLVPNERFYFAIPYLDEARQNVLAVGIIYFENLPTENDIPANILTLLSRSALILLLAAGLIGTIFGFITARGMSNRLQRVSQVTDAWSQGDFSEFIEDPVGDEISQMTARLNDMAEQLQHFLKRSQAMAVSEERNRLARDLHDSAKQEALAASFHLGTALTLFERDPKSARGHLVEADNLMDSVRGELTDLIHELRPPSVNGVHFDETLNEYIIEWAHQTGIGAAFNVEGLADLPLETKQAIYRIMQESLANVARHSSAENIDVALIIGEHAVEFCVSDNGTGFDTLQHHDGMGLDSMRERAESLGGNFSIDSATGQGTKVCVTFPFDQ